MFFDRRIEIPAGITPYLEKATLHTALRCLKTSWTFKEDGIENKDGLLQTYDGDPQHLVWISFSTIEEYCVENNLYYWGGVDDSTGMDMCIVVKKKEP